MAMFCVDADLFFKSPRTSVGIPNRFSTLYLLRRDIDTCLGIDPNSGATGSCRALWPAAMAIMAGIDLLAKFQAGSDEQGKVRQRFLDFVTRYVLPTNSTKGQIPSDAEVIYQLRNSLLHSFGLYSVAGQRTYHFKLIFTGAGSLILRTPPDEYRVDLTCLHRQFEEAIDRYAADLQGDAVLQTNFVTMFGNYGSYYISN